VTNLGPKLLVPAAYVHDEFVVITNEAFLDDPAPSWSMGLSVIVPLVVDKRAAAITG
jgi:hypothetical protein